MTGDAEEIRACIGCNQACIGHFHKGAPISCIQHPETGRETRYGQLEAAIERKRILVVGGGPAGLKAAAIAATRGHEVSLMEADARLGGQALLAQLLPQRAEFGGIVTNLSREVERAGVTVCLNQKVDKVVVQAQAPEEIILACGATPYWPQLEITETAHVVDAWQVLNDSVKVGNSVLIADWTSDWISLGIAEKLIRAGRRVQLATTGSCAGQAIPEYIKDRWVNVLLDLGVEIFPYLRLFGADQNSVFMERTVLLEPVIFEDVDTLVLTQGHKPENQLATALSDLNIKLHLIGDCLAPRNAEAAVLDGLKIGAKL
jgi:pyruvate/2-oxoglutarate dehydrogenase complex dihydrolipoamide dehydrogenase (E3) component